MLDKLLSNKSRFIKIVIASIFLAVCGLYSQNRYNKRVVDLKKCINEPMKYDNRIVHIVHDAMILDTAMDRFTIESRGVVIPVVFKQPIDLAKSSVAVNDYISLTAVFHKEGYLTGKRYHLHKYRRLKMYSSLIIAIVFFILFIRYFKFNFKKFIFEERICRT
jgi:hypothetical protein